MKNENICKRGIDMTYTFCLIKDEACSGFEISGLGLEDVFHIIKVLQGKKIRFELTEEE